MAAEARPSVPLLPIVGRFKRQHDARRASRSIAWSLAGRRPAAKAVGFYMGAGSLSRLASGRAQRLCPTAWRSTSS
jgi:hypothetical protein